MAGVTGDDLVLCADLGGSALRVALIDAGGATRVAAKRDLPLPLDAEGRSEVDPELWWTAFRDAAAAILDGDAAERVRAICCGGYTRTLVLADAAGAAVGPALTWRDMQAGAEAARLAAVAGPAAPGDALHIDAFHPLARIAWTRAHASDRLARAAVLLEPKDYLNLRLTGTAGSDAVSLARLVAIPEPARARLWQAAGLDPALVPALHRPTEVAGRVRADAPPFAALAGVPVMTGCHDTWMGVLGLGALQVGAGYILSGTSEVVGLFTAEPARADGLLTVQWGERLFQLGGPSQAGGDCLAWLDRLLRPEDDGAPDLDALPEGDPSEPLLFLPYLAGERVPLWEPAARGVFFGLGRGHGAADLYRAVVEGVAFSSRQVVEGAIAAGAAPPDPFRIGGGAARSDLWCQTRADVLGAPVVRHDDAEAGLLGAAMTAWTGLGRFASLEAAQTALARPGRRFTPDPARSRSLDTGYRRFRAVQDAALPLFRAFAADRA